MKLHQLQALVASADSGSIRAAARHLGLSQAAVTRAARTGAGAGAAAADPHPDRAGLYPYGKTLLAHARLVLNQLEQAQGKWRSCAGGRRIWSRRRSPLADADGVAAGGDGVSQQGAGGAAGTVGKPDGQCPVAAARGHDGFAITPLPASSAPQEFHCEPLLEYETAYMVRRGHRWRTAPRCISCWSRIG